eukprot:TRINITY_DN89081_c0_g1_i1.p1 TRINITY_DN89081_c0_g1~~TRINITY_DN89081_c0_g1_i1.p1  ORF type:complete len:651 (-),score=99.50 TRINITY_DN89081_c0_g1_i1:256-2208(-)
MLRLAGCFVFWQLTAAEIHCTEHVDPAFERLITKAQAFHNRSKHHFDRMSPRKGNPRWEDQPNSFRTYTGAPLLHLPIKNSGWATVRNSLASLPAQTLFQKESAKAAKSQSMSVTRSTLGSFLSLAMGLTAWKQAGTGNQWTLRANPSSGALHPTEAYLLMPSSLAKSDMVAGLYHYHPFEHALERRADWESTSAFGGFFVALSSVVVRETFKYGERAFRYVNHDVGHAMACIALSAALHGWQAHWVRNVDASDLEKLLRHDVTEWEDLEEEEADLLLWIHTSLPPTEHSGTGIATNNILEKSDTDILSALMPSGRQRLHGEPLQLAHQSVRYAEVYKVRNATKHRPASSSSAGMDARLANAHVCKARTSVWEGHGTGDYEFDNAAIAAVLANTQLPLQSTATAIIAQRRSVQEMDPSGRTSLSVFRHIMAAAMPQSSHPFLNADLAPDSAIHLLMFVHRVDDVEPGIYILVRNRRDLPDLRSAMQSELLWEPVKIESSQDDLKSPLYLLKRGDYQQVAERVSCDQQIAGASAFSLGMLARWHDWRYPARYKELFWESGMVGQLLYLAAETHGMRGTGIGCFYDDEVHRLVGLQHDRFSSIYHFTMGKSLWLENDRVLTRAPYEHLLKGRAQADARPDYPAGGGMRGQSL